jgi:DNA polymerase-1
MLTKLKSTYLDGLEVLVNEETGRIHTTFNQTVTATGRLSSSEPNLQNIPVRTEIGRRIRELFVPGSGYDYIMSADYSQIELRILAHMSGDENLLHSFRHNEDVHTRTASQVFGVPMAEVTSEMRSRAKAVNFGIVYGISDYGLSRDIGVSRKEAGSYIDSYFVKYSGVKSFLDQTVQDAHDKGYVTTLFDRRRYLPDINSKNFNQRSFAERVAMNTPIQGTAADVIKKAMILVYKALDGEKLKSRVLLQVHDELVLEVTADEADRVSALVKKAMEQAVDLAVPMTVEVKMGKNWAAAK